MDETFTVDLVEALYDLETGDTFAARIETVGSALGSRTVYCRVESVCDGIARDDERIMKIERRREPSVDYWISNSIYETDDGGVEIRRLGPSNIIVHGVTENVLAVDYSPDTRSRPLATNAARPVLYLSLKTICRLLTLS